MSERVLTFVCNRDLLELLKERITALNEGEGIEAVDIEASEVETYDEATVALDAPLNQKIAAGVGAIGMITAIFNAGAAGVKLADEIVKLQNDIHSPVQVLDPTSNKHLGTIKPGDKSLTAATILNTSIST